MYISTMRSDEWFPNSQSRRHIARDCNLNPWGICFKPDPGDLQVRFCEGFIATPGILPQKRCATGSTRHFTGSGSPIVPVFARLASYFSTDQEKLKRFYIFGLLPLIQCFSWKLHIHPVFPHPLQKSLLLGSPIVRSVVN